MVAKFVLLFLLFTLYSSLFTLSAQNTAPYFRWDLRLDTKFDNHERGQLNLPTTGSGTFFSVRVAPVIGIGWNDQHGAFHGVMGGVNFILDMGAKPDDRPVEALLYYNYEAPLYSLYAGKFERRRLMGTWSRAMWSGISNFYDSVVDGFDLQYHAAQGYIEVVFDWDGMASATMRESFRIASAGEFNPVGSRSFRWLAMGYSYDMYHLASRTGIGDGVVDHNSVNPWIGVRLHRLFPWFEDLSLQAGWLQSIDRDRKSSAGWLDPGGITVDVGVQKWKIGIRNQFYRGLTGTGDGVQMPLWNSYGNRIYKGDPIFAAARTYNYTQIYWRPAIGRGVELDLELGLHTDGRKMGFQQVIWLGVTLDDRFFRKK